MNISAKQKSISSGVQKASARAMSMVEQGKIKKHTMGNDSIFHVGEREDIELTEFREFVSTKNFDIIYQLEGEHSYE